MKGRLLLEGTSDPVPGVRKPVVAVPGVPSNAHVRIEEGEVELNPREFAFELTSCVFAIVMLLFGSVCEISAADPLMVDVLATHDALAILVSMPIALPPAGFVMVIPLLMILKLFAFVSIRMPRDGLSPCEDTEMVEFWNAAHSLVGKPVPIE